MFWVDVFISMLINFVILKKCGNDMKDGDSLLYIALLAAISTARQQGPMLHKIIVCGDLGTVSEDMFGKSHADLELFLEM